MSKVPTILIIEDDPDFCRVLTTFLETEPYRVVTAASGEEGLRKVRQENPDLIILDVMMEKIITGFEVAHRLKSKDPRSEYAAYAQVPILVLTALHEKTFFRFEPDEEYLPVEEFMEKPVKREEFLRRVERLLRQRTTAAA
ncbi:MAG TPA: response regulator [Armatimonadetes bacterium]|nr:response regulator [Armatimonadota bacterium]